MKRRLKQFAERLTAYKVWIERSTHRRELEELIHSLRARATVAPLIRIGPVGDGGYLLPNDLDGVTACVSPGVSFEVGFDQAMADRAIDVYMADASVEGPPQANDRFHFTKKFIDIVEDERHMRLDTMCASILNPSDGDLILQMDIEGAEWRVLLDASHQTLKKFRIIVIEFHDLNRMFGQFSFGLIKATFGKLLQTHSVVHLHPNNVSNPTYFDGFAVPPVMEMTFYRNDRPFSDSKIGPYPHQLDVDNVSTRPSVALPRCWQT
ncbi:FkbM family methyltransferase [Mesorhizobium sp.]|uniref:FkbM family methyltransferase n=1 Tax=Mesorhizobium sp. TaxID=1871066 RepID=UPI0011FC61A1|nr:FkbM family methyltransferase [Mesorhizobium sp.]TIL54865.1 MAG: FkbM family methyltransferase [Mesorhizobium sp.]